MYSGVLVVFLFFSVAVVFGAEFMCPLCRGEECTVVPEGCLHGTVRDACGRILCAVGPGESCGRRQNDSNKCGDGLSCKCGKGMTGKCWGCSIPRLMSGIIDCYYTTLPSDC